jgi:hypothetical protein
MSSRGAVALHRFVNVQAAVALGSALRGVVGYVSDKDNVIDARGAVVVGIESAGRAAIGDVIRKDNVVQAGRSARGARLKASAVSSVGRDFPALDTPKIAIHGDPISAGCRNLAGIEGHTLQPGNIVAGRTGHFSPGIKI